MQAVIAILSILERSFGSRAYMHSRGVKDRCPILAPHLAFIVGHGSISIARAVAYVATLSLEGHQQQIWRMCCVWALHFLGCCMRASCEGICVMSNVLMII